jgi:hypothetical protein
LAGAGAAAIDWLSPVATDNFAEHRDEASLGKLSLKHLAPALKAFWPARGPQWDGLARTDRGDLLLIEAKAHVAETCSPACQASPASLSRIVAALDRTKERFGATSSADWTRLFYQTANRLAHLDWLRNDCGTPAWLVFVEFVGDADMGGPMSAEGWEAASVLTRNAMGLARMHPLSAFVILVRPDVRRRDGAPQVA